MTPTKQLAEDAEAAFWAVVAAGRPEHTRGDFPPDAALRLIAEMERAINLWTEVNDPRAYRIADVPGAQVVVSYAELAAVNDPETMAEIADLAVGESTILGQCDPIKRLS
jgi:hypothetical protein